MSSSVLLSQLFLPRTAVNLGRFVVSRDEPHRDFHDPLQDTEANTSSKVQTSYKSVDSTVKSREISAKLTDFLSSSHSKSAKTSVSISSGLVKTYFLQNSRDWFREAAKLDSTRKWIERTIDDGEDIYLVVGYYTVTDASVIEQVGNQRGTAGQAVLPVSTALAASGIPLLFDTTIDPGFTVAHEKTRDAGRRYVAQGEQICAVQYRKIRFSWLSSKNLDKMSLAKESRWKRYDQPRGGEDDEEDDDDIIGVDLDEEQEQDVDNVTDQSILEPGEILYSIHHSINSRIKMYYQ